MGVDAVVGHSSASLGPGDRALKKGKAKTSKRKAATQKTVTSGNSPCCNVATASIFAVYSASGLQCIRYLLQSV